MGSLTKRFIRLIQNYGMKFLIQKSSHKAVIVSIFKGVGCPICNLFFHKDYKDSVSLSMPRGLVLQAVCISPPLEGRGWGGVFD